MTRFEGLGRADVTVLDELEPLESYRADVLRDVAAVDVEEVPLDAALGRVLAEDVTAANPLPSFPNSAMDGYAVRAADVEDASADRPARLTVTGEVAAGSAGLPEVRSGTAVRIMTGAPLPPGADAIVPVEVTTQHDTNVEIHRAPQVGDHIRLTGEDVEEGEGLVSTGRRLGPAAIGMIAAAGRGSVRCRRRAVVAVLSTGDELVPPGTELSHGQLHDSNGPMLVALARTEGAYAEHEGRIRDDPTALAEALSRAASHADLVLVSGGVSAGVHDHLPDVLATLGFCRRAKVAMKPGMPQLHGRIGGVPVLGLPGNPVSAYVSFELFGLPLLRSLHGRSDLDRPLVVARAGAGLQGARGKRTFLRVGLKARGDGIVAETTGGQGSHVLSALTRADGLAVIPEDTPAIPAGDPVTVRLLTDLP